MTTRKEIATAFRAAVPYLWDGVSPEYITKFTCTAIRDSRHPAWEAAQAVISARLQGKDSVMCWLDINYPELRVFYTPEQVHQAYRHRWLQELIREFEA
jgi:hypothetical protein